MIYQCHHLEKWANANLDLIEESLEKGQKAVIIIAGASSSGKSYGSKVIANYAEHEGYHVVSFSLDNYNFGLSGIIPNKVNLNYFDDKLENMPLIRETIKRIIYNVPFDKKYDKEVLPKIKEALKDIIPSSSLDKFMDALPKEWALLNFDEPSVYDMAEAARDIKTLLSGGKVHAKEYSKVVSERVQCDEVLDGSNADVVVVEGIYALTDDLLEHLKGVNIIKNFIDGNPKSLYLRRIIRDAKTTSADTAFTTRIYFKYIIKSYNEIIYPSSKNADIIFANEMTFSEMRTGELFDDRLELKTKDKSKFEYLLKNSEITEKLYQRDDYFVVNGETEENMNVLRLRTVSYDEGKTFIPYNLIHKGLKKIRKDGRVIRPINVLVKPGEFDKIWSSEGECLLDFYRAGFVVGRVINKLRYNVIYKGQKLKLSDIETRGYYVDFDEPVNKQIFDEIKYLFDGDNK